MFVRDMVQTMIDIASHPDSSGFICVGEGDPGIGKSQIALQRLTLHADSLQKPLKVIVKYLTAEEPAILHGYSVPRSAKSKDGASSILYTAQTMPALVREAHKWVQKGYFVAIILEEFHQIEGPMQKAVRPLMDSRRLGDYFLPSEALLLAFTNRVANKAGVVRTLSHFQNAEVKFEGELNVKHWEAWATRANLHPLGIRYAQHAPFVREIPAEPNTPFLTPRSLTNAIRTLQILGLTDHQSIARRESYAVAVTQGAIGKGAAGELVTSFKLGSRLPDIEDIVNDPTRAKRIDKDAKDVCNALKFVLPYAVPPQDAVDAAALDADMLDPEHARRIDNVMQYLDIIDMPKDFQIGTVYNMFARSGPRLQEHPALKDHILQNLDVWSQTV